MVNELERHLAAVGVWVPHDEAIQLARLNTASEFEWALGGGYVSTRSEAHLVLRMLKERVRAAQGQERRRMNG